MIDAAVPPDLPTPEQMCALNQAMHASWQARRMREASRGIIIGNIAMVLCIASTMLVLMHTDWAKDIAPFLVNGILGVYFAGVFFSLRWLKRQRGSNSVTVLDRNEEVARTASQRPKLAVAIILSFVLIFTIGWIFALPNMSNQAILAFLSTMPCSGALFFVIRFVSFRFWEDLVFAGCVVFAFVPMYFVRQGIGPDGRTAIDISFLSFVSLGLVVASMASLQYRWIVWTRSLAKLEAETDIMEAQS